MKGFQARRSTIPMLLVFIVFVSGCHRQVAKAPTVPPPTSKPAVPTVALQASPATIACGGSSTLTWSSSNATQATLYPAVGEV